MSGLMPSLSATSPAATTTATPPTCHALRIGALTLVTSVLSSDSEHRSGRACKQQRPPSRHYFPHSTVTTTRLPASNDDENAGTRKDGNNITREIGTSEERHPCPSKPPRRPPLPHRVTKRRPACGSSGTAWRHTCPTSTRKRLANGWIRSTKRWPGAA